MKLIALFFTLVSANALAAPDRQFVCKFSDFQEHAAIFASVSADGLRLRSLRVDSDDGGEVFDVSRVPQFRYEALNGAEDFYALCPDDESNAFALRFSGSGQTQLKGTFNQVILDKNGEKVPAVVNEMNVLCERLF